MGDQLIKRIVAPCGVNCSVCLGYLRNKNKCCGCWGDGQKLNHCNQCSIKNCTFLEQTTSKFCYDCSKYPCRRIKDLDKRYTAKYKTSLMHNLAIIKAGGEERFLELEKERWNCDNCGGVVCIHHGTCNMCGKAKGVKLNTEEN